MLTAQGKIPEIVLGDCGLMGQRRCVQGSPSFMRTGEMGSAPIGTGLGNALSNSGRQEIPNGRDGSCCQGKFQEWVGRMCASGTSAAGGQQAGDQMASVEQRFAGRGAVITGGASGIGWTVAKRLAAEGAKVCIWDRVDAPSGETIEAIRLDITDVAAVDGAAKRTAELLGGIDILVCSAAITARTIRCGSIRSRSGERCSHQRPRPRLLQPDRRAEHAPKDYGRIINVASIAGKEGNPNASAYSASKQRDGLTKSPRKGARQTKITARG